MRNLKFINDGKTILFSSDRKIILGLVSNFADKSVKFITKSLESDSIADLGYCESKKYIVFLNKIKN